MSAGRKSVNFYGSSLDDLRKFPGSVRQEAGFQIDLLQQGREPDDWKPMSDIGSGVREIRLKDSDGIFRVIYVAKFKESVFVLHCCQKKTAKTASKDLSLAKSRYAQLMKELNS